MMSTMIRGTVTVGAQTHVFGHLPHLTVGSSTHDDIVVDDPLVTAGHLRIDWRSTGWWVSADAAAPAYTAGVAVTEILIADVTRIRIGDSDDGPVLIFALTDSDPVDDDTVQLADAPRTLTCAPDGISLRYTASDTVVDIHGILTVGRTPDNDLVIDDPLVSRHHARIALQSDGDLLVDDLASSNGTHVDGRRITRARLPDGSVLTVGNTDFVVRGRQLLRGETPTAGDGLMLHGVGLTLGADTTLLRDAEFTARPGTLTAVIGPSGAGKSTVAAVMAGLTTPTAGVVTFDGRDVHGEYDTLHTRIGMVPQSDVLHRRLTLRHALRYAAEIRLPGDLAADDRNRVVAGVLAELHLTEHLDTRIDMLSGGQRKRASMAMELLTGPSLLILDEPTSGLDPALDRQVMAALRRLANAGRVVLVVTHSLANLTLCDQVVMLAPGGRTAFVGRPEEIPIAFGTTDWAEIFTVLTANPVLAHRRHLERTRATAPPNPVRRPTGAPVCVPRVWAIDQCSTVVRRQIRLIVADPGYLTFLAVLPVVLGLLTLIVPGA
ncbi:MAG: ATP-binding cassette domain-containing protein, partial [Actinomycetota bacterium]|nr:ATP-binding cassette domain-containing protein [Actinomycetota bacterium]